MIAPVKHGKGNIERVRRYRAKHRRIDYAPAEDVTGIIELHLRAGLDNCLAGVIDRLIRAGNKTITGNAGDNSDC